MSTHFKSTEDTKLSIFSVGYRFINEAKPLTINIQASIEGHVDDLQKETLDSNSRIHPEVEIPDSPRLTTQARPLAASEYPLRASKDKLSSNRPNQALLWALIDDSELGAEAHDKAVAIMEGWQPMPWKGMVWRGEIGNDRVWDGREWIVLGDALLVYQPARPAIEQKRASPRLTELFTSLYSNRYGGICKMAAKELNEQYDAWLLDPEGEEENLQVTISAFARSEWRTTQCRRLIVGAPEISTEIDDIFSDFVGDLQRRLSKKTEDNPDGQYVHRGNLDGWIAYIWDKYFLPEKQKKTFKYLNSVQFVNNKDADAPGYKFQRNCVNTANIHADQLTANEGYLVKAILNGDGKEVSYRITADRILREMEDPNTDFGKLKEPEKKMLRSITSGKSQREIAEELDVHPKTVQRMLSGLRSRATAISIEETDTGQKLIRLPGRTDREPVSNVVSIDACAGESFDISADDEKVEVAA